MAKVKLNSMPDYTAKMPKSPHDVSQSTGFTCPPGQISPLYFDMLHLGDDIHFSCSMFARYNPLVTAALGDVDVHLDYFFVPLTVMYTPASSMFYQTDDLLSSQIDRLLLDSVNFPVFIPNGKFYRDGEEDDTWFLDYYGARAQPTYVTDNENRFFDCYGKNVFRMWDFLDQKPFALLQSTDYQLNFPAFTPWFALAYQAVYQLHPGFRNTDREPKLYNYNIDKYYQDRVIYDSDNLRAGDRSGMIFALHYVNRPKDYFQSVKVSPMGSAVSMLKDPGEVFYSVNDWLNENQFVPVTNNDVDNRVAFGSSVQTGDSSQVISSNNIRQLFMVDKILRVIGRAEKNYESQFLAHYGIKIPHDVMHNITHIGHDVATLSASPVISSADTFNGDTGSALGEVGGQGSVMLRGHKVNFKAPFHGVFLVLAYFVPRQRYIAGLNKLHQLNSILDFWQPEYDKKGMQPLFAYEAQHTYGDFSTRLGWQFAYEQFKRRFDRVTFAFAPFQDAVEGTVNTYAPWFVSSTPYRSIGLTGSVTPDSELFSLTYTMFKVHPTDLNGIMQVPYNPKWSDNYMTKPWLMYQTDPFICDFNIHCKKVNGMSEYGEPEL